MFGIAIKDTGTVTLLAVRMNGEFLRDLATRASRSSGALERFEFNGLKKSSAIY